MPIRLPVAPEPPVSISEMVQQHLREGIFSGALRAGQALKQDEIATRLGVSRAPVREALNQLERDGLAILRPRRGYIVASLETNEIADIFDLRMLLEAYAGRAAATKRTLKDVAAVRKLLNAMDRLTMDSPAAIAKWAALNRAFHDAIYVASGGGRLRQIAANLRDTVEQYVRLDALTAKHIGTAQAEHRRILEALVAGDAERVGTLSREHCKHTRDRLIAALRRRRSMAAGE